MKLTTSTEGGHGCATVLLHCSRNLCTLISLDTDYHTSHMSSRSNKNRPQVKPLGVEGGREINGEREGRQGGGANIRKPQLLCVRGTHPWCALKARHYQAHK